MRLLPLTVLFVAAPSAADEPPPPQKVAVLEIKPGPDIDETMAETLNEVLLAAFDEHPGLEVLGASDIRAMLQMEEQRQMFDACADDSCLAEIGGALGASMLAQARIGAVGEQFVVNVKLIDVDNAAVLARAKQVVPKDDSQLLAAVERAGRPVCAKIVVHGRGRLGPGPAGVAVAYGAGSTRKTLTT